MDNRQVQLERANHVLTAMGVDTRNAKVMDRTQYITFDAKGKSSVVLLIDSNTKKLVGETSFDANKLNKGRYFVVDSARVLVEDQAGSLNEANWKSDAHPAVLNSEFKISQVIVPEKEINLSWQFPQGANVPVSQTQFVRIELRGFEFLVN